MDFLWFLHTKLSVTICLIYLNLSFEMFDKSLSFGLIFSGTVLILIQVGPTPNFN
jgi:hypothetical protein